VNILFVGDVVGKVGRRLLNEQLRRAQVEAQADFTIVNVENASGGFGLTGAVWDEVSRLPIVDATRWAQIAIVLVAILWIIKVRGRAATRKERTWTTP